MKIPRRLTAESTPRPPMTAMIDVVFLLLIYFVCTASFTPPESRLPAVSLPGEVETETAVRSDTPPPERLEVQIPPAPAPLVADGTQYRSLAELARLLAAEARQASPREVVLDVDRLTQFGRAIDVYDQCQLAGLQQILFAVRAE